MGARETDSDFEWAFAGKQITNRAFLVITNYANDGVVNMKFHSNTFCIKFLVLPLVAIFIVLQSSVASAQVSGYSGHLSGNGNTAPAAVIVDWPASGSGSCTMSVMNPDGSGSPATGTGTVGSTTNYDEECRTCEVTLHVSDYTEPAECTFWECENPTGSKNRGSVGMVCSWGRYSVSGYFKHVFSSSSNPSAAVTLGD